MLENNLNPEYNPEYTLKPLNSTQRLLLLLAAAVSSSCGLAVELLLGTLASYLVGNQALSYGVAVGGFLAAMGIGSYLSRFLVVEEDSIIQQRELLRSFVKVELAIAPLTACLPLALFALFVVNGPLWIGLFLVTILLGTLAGLEVPLLTRVLELEEEVRDALAGVLALDYLGALVGSLAFPIILLPVIGLFPAAFVLGALPALMVFFIGKHFPLLKNWGRFGLGLAVLLFILSTAAIPVSNALENTLYTDPVIARFQTPYQRIVLTRFAQDVRLFLDGDLQLSTVDEYRYHEALVHPAISASLHKQRVLVLGAGDGMAVREVLKWPTVERVVVIELDPTVVKLANSYPLLVKANEKALSDPKVEVILADAFVTAPTLPESFDVIIADFPDPDVEIIAKLYAAGFYQRLFSRLRDGGVFVTQASSPFFAPKVFSCIVATLKSVGVGATPYVVNVPSFGPWGFVLASTTPIQWDSLKLPVSTRFLTEPLLHNLPALPGDIQLQPVEVNRLSHPTIVRYQSDPRWAGY